MADNASPKAPVLLSKIRQQGDNLLNLYYQLKQERAQALAQNWGAEFPGGDRSVDAIPDGSVMPPTNYNAGATMSVADDFIAFMESGNRVNLLLAARKIQ
jgi:hypothetical protein